MRVRIGMGALLALAVLAAAPSESKAERSERVEVKQAVAVPTVALAVVELPLSAQTVEAVRVAHEPARVAVERSSVLAQDHERTRGVVPAGSSALDIPTLNGSAAMLRLRSRHATNSYAWRESMDARGRSLLTG